MLIKTWPSILAGLLVLFGYQAEASFLDNILLAGFDFLEKNVDLDDLLFTKVSELVGNGRCNENGTKEEYKEYLFTDTSNDDASHMTAQELIARSGYKYVTYEALADDGYITQVIHLINPLADRRYLRSPPLLVEHGGTIDPTAYLIASSIQHHPEKWPRSPKDGPITSWNRSLAFTLANNGFDVWLAETRGASDRRRGRFPDRNLLTILSGRNKNKNMTLGENLHKLLHSWDYWDFSQDDIINHELKSHMDLVAALTKNERMLLFTFSLSTPTSLAFFSLRPDYARRIDGLVSMAPIVSGEGVNKLIKWSLETVCPLLPDSLGTLLITDMLFTQPVRELVLFFSKYPRIRYTFVKAVTTYLLGPSAKYNSLLDQNVMGHMLRKLSFKVAKQLCQQMANNNLQKFDYGPVRNLAIYNSTDAPTYDLSDIHIKDWIIVSGTTDKLAPREVAEHLKRIVNPKPLAQILAPGFNHLDLLTAMGNDIYVNFPIMEYFQKRSEVADYSPDFEMNSSARQLGDIQGFLKKATESANLGDMAGALNSSLTGLRTAVSDPSKIIERISNPTKMLEGISNPSKALEGLQKNVNTWIGSLEKMIEPKDEEVKEEYK